MQCQLGDRGAKWRENGAHDAEGPQARVGGKGEQTEDADEREEGDDAEQGRPRPLALSSREERGAWWFWREGQERLGR